MTNPSLITRIAIGKLTGAILSIAALLIFQSMLQGVSLQFKIAVVLWYITMGAFIGFFGVCTTLPVLNIRISWWFRGIWLGAWMNFVLVLFIMDQLTVLLAQNFTGMPLLNSPWWMVVEGAIVGLVMDILCTQLGGEGSKCVSDQPA